MQSKLVNLFVYSHAVKSAETSKQPVEQLPRPHQLCGNPPLEEPAIKVTHPSLSISNPTHLQHCSAERHIIRQWLGVMPLIPLHPGSPKPRARSSSAPRHPARLLLLLLLRGGVQRGGGFHHNPGGWGLGGLRPEHLLQGGCLFRTLAQSIGLEEGGLGGEGWGGGLWGCAVAWANDDWCQ